MSQDKKWIALRENINDYYSKKKEISHWVVINRHLQCLLPHYSLIVVCGDLIT